MDKTMYIKLIEVIRQFMDLEVSNGLIWGRSQEYSTTLLAECGYEVVDWSWYDGHIVETNSTEYPEIKANYVSCASTYQFGYDGVLLVHIEEVGKLASSETRATHDFDNISIKKWVAFGDYVEVNNFNPSIEFICFVKELKNWQKTFDKTDNYDYTISIYIGRDAIIDKF